MGKRVLLVVAVFLLLAAAAVWLDPTRVLWGWICKESFYQDRPTRREFCKFIGLT
jgi:hypothetical protein